MSRELPARPNLEQLKNQAKALLRAAQAREADALRRFTILPAFAGREVEPTSIALLDAQSAIAREHGFASCSHLSSAAACTRDSFCTAC
jgi:hypothetical protein